MLWTSACKDLTDGLDWLCDVRQLSGAERDAVYDAALPLFTRALKSVAQLTEPANPQAHAFRATHQQLTALLVPAFERDSGFATWKPRLVRDIALHQHADRRSFEALQSARTA